MLLLLQRLFVPNSGEDKKSYDIQCTMYDLGLERLPGKRSKVFFIAFFLLTSIFHPLQSSPGGKLPSDQINDNIIYKNFIKTVLLFREGFELSAPVIQIGRASCR